MAEGRRRVPVGVSIMVIVALAVGCKTGPPASTGRDGTDGQGGQTIAAGVEVPFVEASSDAGLDFVHDNGMSGARFICEILGSGAALFDYDGDGDLDLYLVQGGGLDAGAGAAPDAGRNGDRLYRNDLALDDAGRPTARFVDVTVASGVVGDGYGMGVATGDFDNDGHVDLYVTNFGANQLLRNNADGTFVDVTRSANADDGRWSIGAVFVDYDRDGWLDLFVGNYLDFRLSRHVECSSPTGRRDYCGPQSYAPVDDRLLRNRADGTFEDVSARLGIAGHPSKTLGVYAADFNDDGWQDLYVANDGLQNQLWLNRSGRGFENDAMLSGVALNAAGRPEASMGVTVGDLDGDGDDDMVLAHLRGETNTLYRNLGGGLFVDDTADSGLGLPSFAYTAFGAGLLDYDNDGALDLLTVNGAIRVLEEQAAAGDPLPLRQGNQLFRNRGDGQFDQVTEGAGAAFEVAEVSRGAAFGDVDNDGDVDVVVTNNGGPARLLINQVGQNKAWLGVRVVDAGSGSDDLGARVAFLTAGRKPLWRRVAAAGSYASASDPRVLAGFGDRPPVDLRVLVRWSNGTEETWRISDTGRYVVLQAGSGKAPAGES